MGVWHAVYHIVDTSDLNGVSAEVCGSLVANVSGLAHVPIQALPLTIYSCAPCYTPHVCALRYPYRIMCVGCGTR